MPKRPSWEAAGSHPHVTGSWRGSRLAPGVGAAAAAVTLQWPPPAALVRRRPQLSYSMICPLFERWSCWKRPDDCPASGQTRPCRCPPASPRHSDQSGRICSAAACCCYFRCCCCVLFVSGGGRLAAQLIPRIRRHSSWSPCCTGSGSALFLPLNKK